MPSPAQGGRHMVTPRKNPASGSAKATRSKVSPRAKVANKSPSGRVKKLSAAPAKAAAVEIAQSPTAPPKRVVTTASALEAEPARQSPVGETSKVLIDEPKPNQDEANDMSSFAPPKAMAAVKTDEPAKPAAAESKSEPKPASKSSDVKTSASPKPASRPKATAKSKKSLANSGTKASPKPSVPENTVSAATAKPAQPAKKASIVTQEQKPVTAAKPAAEAKIAPKDTGNATVEVKAAAKPAAVAGKVDIPDVTGFTMMSFEPFMDLWKVPEVDAMVAATQGAFEESVTAASDVFAQLAETFSEQADVFSDAGTHMMARYEELIETQQKSFDGVWQVSSDMMEKGGSFGAELVSWAQREMDASQADLEALAKVESLSDLQELNERIFKRYVESGMSEGEKIQKMMFAAFTDGFAAMTRVAGVPLK
ncbi:phasin family protein [Thalassospira australica]|uniref:phasin family protein n=1 Tax=Thalassospira australica TaxID=1528106 RepID=UPI00384C6F61